MKLRKAEKEWILHQGPDIHVKEYINKTARRLGIPEEIIKFLAERGCTDERDIKDFLRPSLNLLPRPDLMKGMAEAIDILADALKSPKPITVYGDFDADGVTATAVLALFFAELDVPFQYYIPDRLKEGYGLNTEAVRTIYETNKQQNGGPGIIITADCGISDVKVVKAAKQLGFTVIVTDHHRPPPELPPADAILNPLQPGCDFPCKDLAGVGVAFFLILGLRSKLTKNSHWPADKIPNLKSCMDLVAIGTVADQVSITGCNRIIVRAGLEVINQENRIGLQRILKNANALSVEVQAEDIAFRIAPRINAIGRIGSAGKAVELLTTDIPQYAEKLAGELEDANNNRKKIEADIFTEATHMVSTSTLETAHSLLLFKNNWHQGVLGIVASRLAESYGRPTILLTGINRENVSEPDKDLVKGSGRSVEGLDIHAALLACQDMLVRFGGHEGAAGMTLHRDTVESFRQRFDQAVAEQLVNRPPIPGITIDLETNLEFLLNTNFLSAYTLLAPFGNGNPEPVFCMTGKKLTKLRVVGNNHLRFTIVENGRNMDGIGFGFGNSIAEVENSLMDLAFHLKLNSYMGQNKWEIYTVALRPSVH